MPRSDLSSYERALLDSWSETHKKSALMFLILLALVEENRRAAEIHTFIAAMSGGNLGVDEQSLHRALRRIEGLNLITHETEPVPGSGVKRKVYALTETGARVLSAYAHTTLSYLLHPTVQSLITSIDTGT